MINQFITLILIYLFHLLFESLAKQPKRIGELGF